MPYALAKFGSGKVLITQKAKRTLTRTDLLKALERHLSGDWGRVSRDGWERNDEALSQGKQLLSFYRSSEGTPFWIVTEWDRSMTVIQLPGQY